MTHNYFFEKCKCIKENFEARTSISKDRYSNLVTDPTMIAENFKKYFDNLVNDNTDQNTNYSSYEKLVYQTLEPEFPEPSMDKIEPIVKSLKITKHQKKTT